MSLMDKIRQEASTPTVKVSPRRDALAPQGQNLELGSGVSALMGDKQAVVSPQPTTGIQDSQLQFLEAELARYPMVSAKKVGVRLEEQILEEIQELCRRNDITVETLLESFFTTYQGKETVMRQVIKEAQARIQRRTKAGNIRSILTKSRNIHSS